MVIKEKPKNEKNSLRERTDFKYLDVFKEIISYLKRTRITFSEIFKYIIQNLNVVCPKDSIG